MVGSGLMKKLVMAVVVLGAVAAGFLLIAVFPEITPPTVRVTASYPGANASTAMPGTHASRAPDARPAVRSTPRRAPFAPAIRRRSTTPSPAP